MKKVGAVILVGLTIVALAVPVAAQGPAAAGLRRPGIALMRVARNFVMRIRQGVRANEISPAERNQLKSELLALRSEIRGIRRSGVKPTPEQRAAVLAQLRQINRDIYTARHGDLQIDR